MTQHYKATYPNADAVNRLVERASKLTLAEAEKLEAAWESTWGAEGDDAWEAAWRADGGDTWTAWDTAWRAAGGATWNATRAALGTALDAAWDAAQAIVVRDLISDADYQTLVGPWESVMGPVFKENWKKEEDES